ncbi:SANT/Myb-like DNA-binding domain-containing protein [Isoptericola halotolerans]|uniref:SANT/Myb-like DNA-binding domain-containing protein n=1 Tax=Isoptericola halotolerans TaxID=300560 RepID=UPI0038901340
MEGKNDRDHEPDDDQRQARREHRAQERLSALAAGHLEPRPWRPHPLPPAAGDLVQLALWRSSDLGAEDLLSALTLLPAARAEVDGLEAGLLFTARSAGLTWAQIAEAMGYRSPQACQQHFTRLVARQGESS